MADPRRIALEVLLRVEEGGAYSNLALDAALSRAGALDQRDAALATELVYGCLRRRAYLDFALERFSRRPLAELDPPVREALRLGAYQLFHSRAPEHAAVSSAVDLVKGGRGAEKYVNAVLRALLRGRAQLALPADPVAQAAIEESHPRWLVDALWNELGPEEALAFLRADNEPAPTVLRARAGRASASELAERLLAEGLAATRSPAAPQAVRVRGGSAQRTRAWAEGLCTVQDEAAQLVGHLCAPRPGARCLDLCAAPGGKATHLAELGAGTVLAVDLSPRKLRDVEQSAARLGLAQVATLAADARQALPGVPPESFDLVLVDAPCSGTGTLRRHPELRWRRGPDDVARLVEIQGAVLDNAARYVRPGGALVYAVCSVLRAEGVDQVERFLAAHANFSPASLPEGAPPELAAVTDGRGFLATWPHRSGLDGFFAARMARPG